MGESGMAFPLAPALDSFKYCELQSLAKSLGLRANLRGDKLLKSLKEHFQHELKKENKSQNGGSNISASSRKETEMLDGNEEKPDQEAAAASATSPLGGGKATPGNSGSEDHSEMIESDYPGSPRQKKYQKGNLLAIAEATKPSKDKQKNKWTLCSEENEMEDDTLLNIPSGGKSPHRRDGLSKPKKKKTIFTTPNFKKIHEAHFKEMESIDKYIDRKKKRMEVLNNSVKELRILAKKANLTGTPHSNSKKSSSKRVMSPVPQRGRPSSTFTPVSPRRSLRKSLGTANRSILCQKPFKPSTLSTNKMNVRFSEATQDNEHKRSLTKTPARKSPYVSMLDTEPKCQTVLVKNKEKEASQAKAEHTPAVTPFKFTAEAVQTPVSNKKPVFDLKASLSRPLRYEPHKGRLKPWGEPKENIALNETTNRIDCHKKTYKQPRLQTREEQRRKHEQKRKEKKDGVLGTRRGLVMLGD
ncbi:nucleolar and spindle-associated protein 1 isoform X2 [Trichosurus vulpecula]|uniref:nucleolar and spindle-associated protein 1 isoform X2 n=1 Tax=Trichosurus vulpecula TaxID=9337 RepID=UPI00186B2DE3|nr:nucleolar and spindle-associated protein 1 isoform X2 [Trichosurus vulpecula]